MKKEKIADKLSVVDNTSDLTSSETPENTKGKAAKITKVGAMLKEVRQQKGLKLVDIAKILCIRRLYLEAIETSDYDNIPALPYGAGFIRSYANFLGLNGENIVDLYKEETNISSTKDMHILEPQSEASMPGLQYLLISILSIAILYAVWTVFNQNEETISDNTVVVEAPISGNDSGVIVVEEFNFEQQVKDNSSMNEENLIQKNDQIIVSEQKYQEDSLIKAKDDLVNNETKESDNSKAEKEIQDEKYDAKNEVKYIIPTKGVFIEVLKETWIEVKDDTRLYISKILQAGDSYKIPDRRGMILSVGKVDGVNVYIDGVITKVVRPGKKTNIVLDSFLNTDR